MVGTQQARLFLDTGRTAQVLGRRSGTCTDDRSMLFRAGDMSIDVLLQSGGAGMVLLQGQIMTESGSGPVSRAVVHLGDPDDGVQSDEFGQFSLHLDRPQRSNVLWIETEGRHAVLCTIAPTEFATETR